MLLRGRIFSLAFLSFLIFSPLSSVIDVDFGGEEEYTYASEALRDVGVEGYEGVNIELDAPPPWTCFDANGNKFSFINADPNKCAPRSITWEAGFGFNSEDLTGTVFQIRFFWKYLETGDFTQVNATWDSGSNQYRATANFTYPTNGTLCTYDLVARLRIDGVNCNNADANILESLIVWDDISNTNLGIHDINHDVTSAGVEIGETVELCMGDDSPVRLIDSSTFNCSTAFEPEPTNENRRTRWVQWVYGTFSDITTGPGATEKIIIDGLSYTNGDLPIYGNPTQQPFPPDVLVPNAITDNIQMPTTAVVGERFEVIIRSFNVCNPYSTNLDLSPPQGGANDVFQINGPGGTEQPALTGVTGGGNYFANDNPIARTFDIIIAPQPPPPVAVPKDVCNGSALPNFQVTAAGNVAVEWYEDNAGVIDFGSLIPNSLGGNSLQLRASDFEPGGAINNNTAGVYEVWARYSSNTGTQLCWSEPTITSLDVRELLLTPASVSSSQGGPGFTICADGPNIVFTVDDGPPGVGVPGGAWEYDWSFGGGTLNDNLGFVTPDGGQSRTVNITSNAASGARRVRVRRRYTSAADNGDCASGRFNFDFNIDPVSIGGSLTGTNTICLGDNTGNIQLTGQTGAITRWEVDINGGGFVAIGMGGVNPINPIPGVIGTHEYRAVLKSGICAVVRSSTVTITVNPVPPKPTITPSGPTTFCEDTNVILSSSNTDADSYQWYKDGVPIGSETNQTINLSTLAESGDYTVEVIGIGPSLCTSPISDPTTVLVNPLPTATVIGGGSVCSGNPAPDMIWTIVGTAPFSFTITRPAGEGPALPVVEPTNTYTYSGAISSGNYTMTLLQGANGCNSISMGGAAVVTIGGVTPTLSNLAVDGPICEDQVGASIPFWHVDTDVAGDYDIDYTIDGNPQPTESFNGILAGGTISHQVSYAQLGSSPGTYTVVLTGAVNTVTGCVATLPGGSVDIIINPQPAIATNPVNNISCSAGAGVVLSVDAPPAGTKIHWYQDAALTVDAAPAFGSVAGAQDQAFTPTASATAAFFAVVESTTGPTFCQSANAIAVIQSEDLQPSPANAETTTAIGVPPLVVGTCDDTFTFNATAADFLGTGTWSTPTAGITFSNANDPAAVASNIPLGVHTFTWTITSSLGVCATSFDSYDVERHTLPAASDMTADFCEVLPQSSDSYDVTALDLTSFDDTVTGIVGSVDRSVAYFTDAGLTIPVAPPYNVADNDQIFARVLRTDVVPQCQSSSTITFNIITLPDAIDQDDLVNPIETEFCEDFPVGSGTKTGINLTNLDDDVTNGQANRSVTWFTDPGYSVAVPDPTNASATNGLIFYPRVTETASGQGCIDDAEVTITVNTRPAANPIIGADTQCISVSTSLYQIAPGPAGTTYIWTVPAGFTVFGGGTPVDFFVLLQFPIATTQTLEVTEISPDNCAGVLEQLIITVQPTPPISVITGPAAVCENEAGVAYSVTNTANTTYAWTVPVGASIILGQGTSAVIVNFGVTGGNVEVIPTSSAGCSGGTATLGVTVNPLPILDPNLDNTVCSQDDISINLVHDAGSPVAAAAFDVTASVTPGLVANVGPTTGPGLLGAAIFNDNYTNTTGGPLVVTYTVTPISADNCAGPAVNVFATINPEPSMAAGLDITVCSDLTIGLNLNTAGGSVAAASYNITSSVVPGGLVPGGANAIVPQNTVAANYLSLDTYTNIGNIPLVVQYTVVPVSAANCLGSPLLINATIDPEPVIDPTLNTTECSDLPIGVTLATNGVSVGAVNYNLVNVAIPGGLTAGGANAAFPANGIANSFINSDTYTNVTTLPVNVVYEVQGVSATGCIGDSEFITVTIDPEPVMSTILSTTVCSDAASGITFVSVGTAVAANDYNVVDVVIPVGATPAGTNAVIPANNQVPGYINGDSYTNLTALPIDVVYEVRGVSAAGCVGDSEFITLTIDPEPVVDPALNATVCSDDVIGITFNTNGISVAALSYDLLSINAAPALVADPGNVILANGIMAGYIAGDIFTNTTNASLTVVYEVRGTAAATGCKGDAEFITATIDPEPVMSPALNTTVCSDAIVNVNFANNGASIPAANYNVVNLTIPAGITSGVGNVAVPANGVISGYIALDTYTNQTANPLVVIYDVQGVSGAACIGDIESISITINPEPVINTGLDAIACSDAIIGLTLNTNGSSVAAANYNINAVTIPAGLIAGANAVVPANAVGAGYLNGDLYTNQTNAPIIVIYEVKGISAIACVGDSEFINITIDPEPVIDNTLGGTVCSDAAIALVLATDGSSVPAIDYNVVSVTLAAGLVAGGANVAVPANNVALGYLALDTYSNPTNNPLNVSYDVQGNSAVGCTGDIETITIVIDPEPVISPALDKTVCSDGTINLTLATNGTSVAAANYNVKAVTVPVGLTAAGTNAVIPGNGVAAGYIFADSYTNPTAAAINVTYEVTGVSGTGCEGDSEFIILTIDPEPVIDPSLDATVCSDDIVGITMNTNGSSVAAANYNILNVTISAGLVAGGANVAFPVNGVVANYFTNDTYTNQTTGQLIVTYEIRGVSGSACIGDSEIISVTIDAEPVVSNTLNTTVCSDDAIAVNFSTDASSIGALDYNLLNVTITAGLTPAGGNVGFPANGVAAAYIAGDSFTNSTAGTLTVTYDVQGVSAAGCVGDTRSIIVSIDPEPVVDPALDATVCSDQLIGLIFATDGVSIPAADYNLISVTVGAGLVAGGGNVVSANGINANYVSGDVYTNLTNASIIVTYEVTGVSAGGCVGDAEFIDISIDPEPIMNPGLDNTICSDDVTALMLNDNGAGIAAATFNIVAVTIPGGLTPAGGNAAFPANGVATGYLSADTYNNVTAAAIIVIYEVRGVSAAGCVGDSEFINFTIDPEPVMNTALNTTICSDDVTNVIFDTNGTSVLAANYDVINVTIPAGLTPAGTNAVFPANSVAAGYVANDTYTNQTNGVINVTYEVRGTSAVGCVGENELIIVMINPEPVINTGLDNSICSDAVTGLVLNTNGISIGASNYNIIGITVDPGLTADPGNVAIPAVGVASAYLSNDIYTNATNGPLDVVYEVRGVSLSACEGDSEFVTITIEPGPIIDPALNTTLCSEDIIGVTLGTAGGSVAAISYNVIGITPNPSLIVGGGNVPIAVGVAANYIINDTYTNTTSIPLTVIYEVKGVSAATCVGPSEFITVTIDPEPVIDPGLDKAVCSEDAVGLILNTNGVSVGATTYNVVNVTIPAGLTPDPGNAPFPAIGVVDGYLSNDKYTNLTNASLIVIYEARGESGSTCEGQSRFINITIDPQPVVDPGLNTTVCSDDPVGVTLTTNGVSVAAAAYNIIAVTVAGALTASGSNVAIPANGVATGYFTADSYTNTTNTPLDVIYEVQGVSAIGCIGNSEFITVTIDSEPVVDPAITNTVCSDEIIIINLGVVGTSVAAATYDVLNVTIPAGLTAGANAAIPGNAVGLGYLSTDTYTNATASPIIVTYEVRGTSIAGCVGDSEFLSVTINPEPVLNPALDAISCSDEISGIVFSTNGTSVAAPTYNLVSVTPQAGLIPDPGNALPALGVLSTYIQNDQFTNTGNIDLIVQYVVEPVSPQNCVGDQLTILFTIHPEPVLDPGLSPAPVCSDVASGVILNVAAGSVAADHYNIVNITWDPALLPGGANSSIGNNQAANAISGDTYTNTSNVQKLVTYDIIPVSIDNCAGDIAQVIFTINPAPAMSNSLDRIVCTAQVSGIILATNGVSTPAQNYEVQSVVAPGLIPGGGNVALPVTSINPLVINGDIYSNPTNNPLTAVYTIVPISAAGCRGPAVDVTLTVEPTVTALANNTLPTICSNSNANITLTSPTVPTAGNIVFNLTAVASSPSVSGFIPVLNFLPQGYVIADFLVNTGNAPETVTYTITPVASGGASGSGCTGASIIEVVTIDPLPIITPGQLDIVCSNIATNYTITTINNLVGTTFTWLAPTLSDPGLTGGSARGGAGSSAPITDTFINTTSIRQMATYNIIPTGPSGCVGTITQLNIFIDPLPTGTISVDQPVVCMNGSAILGFTMTVGVAPFEIVYSDGTTDFTISNIANTHFIAQNGLTATTTYELKSVLDVNGCLQNLVGQTVTVIVENPISDFTADITNDCTPLLVTFTNNDIQAGTQYEWNWGDGSPVEIDNSPTITHTFINNSTVSDISFNVIMTAQIINGAVVCTNASSEFITIKATVNLNVTPSTTEGCSPLLVSFMNNSQGVLANTWFWREQGTLDQNDLTSISSASFVINNPTTTTKIYEVVYQGDRNGCSDELITEITVHPELVADFSVAPSTVVSILNPTITVTNNTLNKASWNHVWDWGDGQTTNAIDPGAHTYAAFGVYALSLVITDPSGFCTSQKFETITVEPVLPIVDFEVDFTEGCRPFTVTFTNLSTSVDPATYLWEFRNALGTLVGTSNLENPSFTFFDSGVINVTLSGSNPLGITDTETKLALIEIYDIPTASFTVTPETVFLPDQLLFTSNLSFLADAFEWDFNGDGDTDSEEFEPQHKYESAGVYNISLIAINTATTCRDTLKIDKAVKVVEAGVADIPNGFFPESGGSNPGGPGGSTGGPNSSFLPRLKGVRDDGFEMQIFDRWGHLIFESKDKNIGWNGRDANGKLYPVGVYVYKVDVIYISGQQTTILGDVTLIR